MLQVANLLYYTDLTFKYKIKRILDKFDHFHFTALSRYRMLKIYQKLLKTPEN